MSVSNRFILLFFQSSNLSDLLSSYELFDQATLKTISRSDFVQRLSGNFSNVMFQYLIEFLSGV